MSDAVSVVLSCSSCGARLEITTDIDRFVCLHCGSQQVVRRGGGIISLQPLVQGIERVQLGTDKTAAELAMPRLMKEIAEAKEKLAEIENMLPEKFLSPPDPNNMVPVLTMIVAAVSLLVFLIIDAAVVGIILIVPLTLVVLIRSQKAQKIKLEQWLDQVAVRKGKMSKAPWHHLQMLERKLAENRQIANM